LYNEIELMAKSGRYTIQDLTDKVRGHGYIISHSAMGRFRKRLLNPAFGIMRWAIAHPKEASTLAHILKDDPDIVFVALSKRSP
jgi:hypothetical protein